MGIIPIITSFWYVFYQKLISSSYIVSCMVSCHEDGIENFNRTSDTVLYYNIIFIPVFFNL